MKRLAVKLLMSVAILMMCLVATLHAQEARGTISGKVLDSNQASVPGANVKITNVAMGTTVSVVTNDSGLFQAP